MRLLCAAIVAGSCVFSVTAVAQQTNPPEKQATGIDAINKWLADMDKGDYEQCWYEGGKILHDAVPLNQWLDDHKKAPIYGKCKSRTLLLARTHSGRFTPPNAPPIYGDFLRAIFDSTYETQPHMTETLMALKEDDGVWRVFAYDVRPAAAPPTAEVPISPNTPLDELQMRATAGEAAAQNELGARYQAGLGVTRDYAQALAWYHKAADQGNAMGERNVGNMYYNGLGVTLDFDQAKSWYEKAASQGEPYAEMHLGIMYITGTGVDKDTEKARTLLQKASDQGNAKAQCNLGLMYYHGDGVTQDYKQAASWFQKSANQGYADAETDLGAMYAQGQGVEKNMSVGVDWLKKAAAQGSTTAQGDLQQLGQTP